jgi:hypothetical protein
METQKQTDRRYQNSKLVDFVREIYLNLKQREVSYTGSHGGVNRTNIEPFDLVKDMESLGYSYAQIRRRVIWGGILNLIGRQIAPWPINDYFIRLHWRAKNKLQGGRK